MLSRLRRCECAVYIPPATDDDYRGRDNNPIFVMNRTTVCPSLLVNNRGLVSKQTIADDVKDSGHTSDVSHTRTAIAIRDINSSRLIIVDNRWHLMKFYNVDFSINIFRFPVCRSIKINGRNLCIIKTFGTYRCVRCKCVASFNFAINNIFMFSLNLIVQEFVV